MPERPKNKPGKPDRTRSAGDAAGGGSRSARPGLVSTWLRSIRAILKGPPRRNENGGIRKHCRRGTAALKRGDLPAAIEEYEEALGIEGAGRCVLEEWRRIRKAARWDRPLGELLQALGDKYPDDPVVALAIGDLRLSRNDPAAAEAIARQMFDSPDDPRGLGGWQTEIGTLLAQSLARAGRPDEAFAFLRERMAADPGDVGPAEAAANLASEMGSMVEARDLYEEALSRAPGRADIAIESINHNRRFDDRSAEAGILARFDHVSCGRMDNLGRLIGLHLENGDTLAARRLLEKAVADGFDTAENQALLAVCDLSETALADAARRIRRLENRLSDAATMMIIDRLIDAAGRAPAQSGIPDDDIADLRSHRHAIRSRSPSEATKAALDDLRKRHVGICRSPEVSELRETQSTSVAIVCPVHRPKDVANAVRQIGTQSWRNRTAVFAINSEAITEDDIRRDWNTDVPLDVVDCIGIETIGGILNRAIDRTACDLVIRFDADDIYLPHYVRDTVLAMARFDADVTAQPRKFHLYRAHNLLTLKVGAAGFMKPAAWGSEAGGSTLSFRRSVFETLRFQEYAKTGEDEVFVKQAIARGLKVRMLSLFNHVFVISADPEDHTWPVDALVRSILRPVDVVGDESAIPVVAAGGPN